MAMTNNALKQANAGMAQLATANSAQMAANAGRNVGANVRQAGNSYGGAAVKFRNVANILKKLNLPGAAAKFNTASRAAEAAGAAKSARNAADGLNMVRNAMMANMKRVNNGLPPTNMAGVV